MWVVAGTRELLRIYLHSEGLVRLATEAYSNNNIRQKIRPPYSVNKRNLSFSSKFGVNEAGGWSDAVEGDSASYSSSSAFFLLLLAVAVAVKSSSGRSSLIADTLTS
jgi:hypothetical protein